MPSRRWRFSDWWWGVLDVIAHVDDGGDDDDDDGGDDDDDDGGGGGGDGGGGGGGGGDVYIWCWSELIEHWLKDSSCDVVHCIRRYLCQTKARKKS